MPLYFVAKSPCWCLVNLEVLPSQLLLRIWPIHPSFFEFIPHFYLKRFHISKDAYRVVQLDLTPQIEVFCMLFDITYEFHSSISKMAYRILPLSAENPVGPPCTFFRWTLYSDTVLWCLLPNASQQDHIMFDNLNTSEKSMDSGPWRKIFLASSPSSSARSHTSSGSFRIKN